MSIYDLAEFAISALEKEYPEAKCSLTYNTPLELIISARLSAQCTDIRVNLVTPELFIKFPTVYDFAKSEPEDIEQYICSCGLYRTKARDIVTMCRELIKFHNGKIPNTIEELTKLTGIGNKTANLILGEIYKKPAIIVDTHFIRITNRVGFHKIKEPVKIENIMREIIPKEKSTDFCHRIVNHGRLICGARQPNCSKCCMKDFCEYINKN